MVGMNKIVPLMMLEGAPRHGLSVTRVTSIREFEEQFTDSTPEEKESVRFFMNRGAGAMDVVHAPEQRKAEDLYLPVIDQTTSEQDRRLYGLPMSKVRG